MTDTYSMKLLGSKLSMPELSNRIIHRPRLIERLQDGPETFLYLLVAPAGYGKSTLAIQFMQYLTPSKHAWYFLDNSDTDLLRFINYLVGTLDRLMPGLLQSGILDMLKPAGNVELIDELCYWIEKNKEVLGCLTIDNWEEVNTESEHNDIIKRLVRSSRGRLNIIITSRVKPAFGFRKSQEKNECVLIGKDELAFNFMEFSKVVKAHTNQVLDDRLLEEFWRKTEGWCVAAGFQSFPDEIAQTAQKKMLLETGGGSGAMTEYVQDEILRDIPQDLFKFLVRCSVLDIITPESAQSITDDVNAEEMLIRLSKTSIPCVVLDQPSHVRLHPLIRDSLVRLLHEKYGRPEVDKIYISAAEYYRRNEAVIEAIELLLANRSYEVALAYMEDDWLKILAANGLGRARYWLNRFPGTYIDNPKFLYIKARVFSALGQNRQLVDFLAGKLNPMKFKNDIGIFGNLWIYYHWSLLHLDKVPDYRSIKNDWDELGRKYGPFSKSIEAGANLTISLAAYQNLEYEMASRYAEKCLKRLDEKQFDYRMTVLNNLAMYRHHLGYTSESLGELRLILEECRRNSSYAIVPMILINMAELNISQAQFTIALSNIDDAFEIMDKYNIQNAGVIMYAERLKGLAYWYTGEHERGLNHLEKSYMAASEYNEQERLHTEMLIGFYKLLDNKLRINKKAGSTKDNRCCERNLIEYALKATEFFGQGDWVSFIKEAEVLLDLAGIYQTPYWQITACLYLALGSFNLDNKRNGKKFLHQGLMILEKFNLSFYPMAIEMVSSTAIVNAVRYSLFPKTIDRFMSTDYKIDLTPDILRHLDDSEITYPQIHRLIKFATKHSIRGLSSYLKDYEKGISKKSRALVSEYLKFAESVLLPPLKICTFDSFSVTVNNRPVTFRRNKSRQLLQLLIINELKPLHEEVIMEILWPECDASRGKSGLHTCIRDLRRALDPYYNSQTASYIHYGNQHYSLALPEDSYIDVLELINILKRGTSFKGNLSFDEEQKIKRALNLYRGEFLREARFETYAMEFREKLNNDFLRISLSFAKYLIGQTRPQEAERLLLRGLEIDPLWGEGVELLMKTYAGLGELFKTLRVYRKYENCMNDELGLDPDDSIKAHFNRLMAGRLTVNK